MFRRLGVTTEYHVGLSVYSSTKAGIHLLTKYLLKENKDLSHCFEKIPIIMAGNMEDAARPKARATVCAANPGGFKPR